MPCAALRPSEHRRFLGITARTSRTYKQALRRFFQYTRLFHNVLPNSFVALDEMLSEYINHLYQEGDHLSQAGWVLSAMKRFYPRARRQLPTAQQFYNNWKRQHVPSRAVPLTWLVVRAMAAAATRVGRMDMALCLFLGFVFFLRTGEILALRAHHVSIFPEKGTIFIALPDTKTSRGLMESVSLSDQRFCHIIHKLWLSSRPSGLLFAGSAANFRRLLRCLLCTVDCGDLNFSAYSLRRGGATHFYQMTNNLNATVLRGRWRDMATARLYIDDARASLIQLCFSEDRLRLLNSFAGFWGTF